MFLNKYKKVFLIKIFFLVIGIIIFFVLSFFSDFDKGGDFNNNMIFILDLSHSMNVQDSKGKYDLPISRLDLSKLFIKSQIEKYPDFKYGLIIFAGNGNFYIPPTSDKTNFNVYIDALNTGIIPQGGSNIYQGLKKFFDLKNQNNVGILISDMGGMNDFIGQKNDIQKMVQEGGNLGNLYIVGVGTTKGGTVKYPDGQNFQVEGHNVSSSLNTEMGNFLADAFHSKFIVIDSIGELGDFSISRGNQTLHMDQNTQILLQVLAVLFCLACI